MSNNRFVPSSSLAETVSEGLDTMSTISIDTESLGLNDIYDRNHLGLWRYDPELHQQTQVAPQPDGHSNVDGLQTDNMSLFLNPDEYQHFPFR